MDHIYSCSEWIRVGRGSELQFFALDDELDRWIAEGLPREFAPYCLLASDMVEVEHRRYEERLSLCETLSVAHSREGTERSNFWIASQHLSPDLPDSFRSPRDCSINGLILVQQWQTRGARDIGRIAVTPKIRQILSGNIVEHKEYVKIFRALAKRIKADLKYATIVGEGNKAFEDRNLALMTAAAAEASTLGRVRFTRRPGRAIR